MYSAMVWVLAIAMLCVAAALMLWRHAETRRVQTDAKRFIDSRLEPTARGGAVAQAVRPTPTGAARSMPQPAVRNVSSDALWAHWYATASEYLSNLASRAGIADARGKTLAALAVMAVVAAFAGSRGGALACFAALACGGSILGVWLASRIQRRRLKIVRQIPSFLDGIVRLVTLGNSVPAAFQSALLTTEEPLRGCLDHVSRMLRGGVEIDRAMVHIAKIYRTEEFELVGSVLRLSVKYGGRADVMLERMAVFMRDLEQAERELTAMSAETRLSAFVLVMLPIGIGSFIVLNNPKYLYGMWNDPGGRMLLMLAFLLQLTGSVWLYRMARLR
ncbi:MULTISPECIES: type II secretion system F family protein [Burkholderia]|jgi:tight adherence protein B|uniref:type II secretion system F family protein n=1 Tax=Burkholderia TaxID=32008 RepID=UPI000D69DEC7|nr:MULTISPECIES: type II secretion system F family protein [Burkholderia]MDP9548732.1 tight adherence protein B [Burkholderia cepacia]ELW9528859.1 type II secretion system F family protein [Burkholderia cenocepacia]MBR8267023.1 type II secretion system F family protein [Burkholderia cenocepacia]MBR8394201.1 type II secretion system F family protein [Burkholderia cenocepacia]MBR8471261.1 type II secretion system F family protein [Burkholderia cenocepacia]